MKAEYIHCFTEGLSSTLPMFLGEVDIVKKRTDSLKDLPNDSQVHILLGLTGELYGSVIMSFQKKDSLLLAGKMMGMEIGEHSEISYSAIKEILNIVSGTAVTKLASYNKKIDVTPPLVITGEKLGIQLTFPLVSLKYQASDINIRLSFSIKERTRKSILIVDDSKFIRDSSKDILEKNDFDVVATCDGGQSCLDYIENNPSVDIILLDVQMPDIDGLQVLQNLRDKNVTSKIIIFTALGDQDTIKKATSIGVDGYMIKPMNESLLIVLKNI